MRFCLAVLCAFAAFATLASAAKLSELERLEMPALEFSHTLRSAQGERVRVGDAFNGGTYVGLQGRTPHEMADRLLRSLEAHAALGRDTAKLRATYDAFLREYARELATDERALVDAQVADMAARGETVLRSYPAVPAKPAAAAPAAPASGFTAQQTTPPPPLLEHPGEDYMRPALGLPDPITGKPTKLCATADATAWHPSQLVGDLVSPGAMSFDGEAWCAPPCTGSAEGGPAFGQPLYVGCPQPRNQYPEAGIGLCDRQRRRYSNANWPGAPPFTYEFPLPPTARPTPETYPNFTDPLPFPTLYRQGNFFRHYCVIEVLEEGDCGNNNELGDLKWYFAGFGYCSHSWPGPYVPPPAPEEDD